MGSPTIHGHQLAVDCWDVPGDGLGAAHPDLQPGHGAAASRRLVVFLGSHWVCKHTRAYGDVGEKRAWCIIWST